MKLSRGLGYGLKFLLLFSKDQEKLRSARDLARQEGLPETFVRQILLRLRKAGFLAGEKGRVGGYKLAKSPERIKVAAVLRALEEDLTLALGRGGKAPEPLAAGKGLPYRAILGRTGKEVLGNSGGSCPRRPPLSQAFS